jgi:hypothetical protein
MTDPEARSLARRWERRALGRRLSRRSPHCSAFLRERRRCWQPPTTNKGGAVGFGETRSSAPGRSRGYRSPARATATVRLIRRPWRASVDPSDAPAFVGFRPSTCGRSEKAAVDPGDAEFRFLTGAVTSAPSLTLRRLPQSDNRGHVDDRGAGAQIRATGRRDQRGRTACSAARASAAQQAP